MGPWDHDALNRRRLALWQEHPTLAPHAEGVFIVDETGDRKRGHGIVLAANQYIGKLGHTANGVVSVTSHWADGTRHVPLGVRPYRPASRRPQGKADPAFSTKPELAWELVEEARAAGIPFRVVVADCVYGENPKLEGRLFAAGLRYVLALRPNRGTWQFVEDEAHPPGLPAFTPAEAAQRLPKEQWQRTVRRDSHGKALVRYVAELELGTAYGPTRGVRLVAATDDPIALDPIALKADSTWFMATNLPCAEADAADAADAAEGYRLYSLRDWIEHYYKPAKHELGWADFQVRAERAIVRHWHLVMLAFTFSLLAGSATGAPAGAAVTPTAAARGPSGPRTTTATPPPPAPPVGHSGGIRAATPRLAGHAALRPRVAVPVGSPSSLLESVDHRRTTAPPPAELAALLDHVAHSRSLDAPT